MGKYIMYMYLNDKCWVISYLKKFPNSVNIVDNFWHIWGCNIWYIIHNQKWKPHSSTLESILRDPILYLYFRFFCHITLQCPLHYKWCQNLFSFFMYITRYFWRNEKVSDHFKSEALLNYRENVFWSCLSWPMNS